MRCKMANSATNEENLRIVSFHIDAKNAVSLDEDLKKMNSSERSSVLAANQYGDWGILRWYMLLREGLLTLLMCF